MAFASDVAAEWVDGDGLHCASVSVGAGTLFLGITCDGGHTQRDAFFDFGAEVEVKAMLHLSGEERGYVDPCICVKSFSLEAGQG